MVHSLNPLVVRLVIFPVSALAVVRLVAERTNIVLVVLYDPEHSFHHFCSRIMGCNANVQKPLIGGVVLMLFGFLSGIIDVLYFYVIPQFAAHPLG